MSIAVEEVKHAAHLAGLSLSKSGTGKFKKQLSAILGYIQQLDKAAGESVTTPERVAATLSDLRKDIVCPSLAVEDALKNAPSIRAGMFNVPKVI